MHGLKPFDLAGIIKLCQLGNVFERINRESGDVVTLAPGSGDHWNHGEDLQDADKLTSGGGYIRVDECGHLGPLEFSAPHLPEANAKAARRDQERAPSEAGNATNPAYAVPASRPGEASHGGEEGKHRSLKASHC